MEPQRIDCLLCLNIGVICSTKLGVKWRIRCLKVERVTVALYIF